MAKVKIPKRVGGVKIPKKVRKKAKKALKVVESPVVRDVAVAALGAAAKAKVDRVANDRGPNVARTLARIDGDKLGTAIRAAALDGLNRFLEGFEEGLRRAASDDDRKGNGKAASRAADAAP